MPPYYPSEKDSFDMLPGTGSRGTGASGPGVGVGVKRQDTVVSATNPALGKGWEDANTVVSAFSWTPTDQELLVFNGQGEGKEMRFISAWKRGAPLKADAIDPETGSARIQYHDGHSQFGFPASSLAVTGSPGIFTASSAAPVSAFPGSKDDGATGKSGNAAKPEDYKSDATQQFRQRAHGALMGIAFLILFPIGAILIRVRPPYALHLHVGVQVLGLALAITGFAVGIVLGNSEYGGALWGYAHARFGVAIFVLLLVQPVLGVVHHRLFLKRQRKSPVGRLHRWYGRGLVVMAIINGALGLKLAEEKAYPWWIVVGVMAAIYLGVVALAIWRKRRNGSRDLDNKGSEWKPLNVKTGVRVLPRELDAGQDISPVSPIEMDEGGYRTDRSARRSGASLWGRRLSAGPGV